MKATTEQIVSALRVLSVDIQSEDGVANAVVTEAADRLTLMANLVARHVEETKDDIKQMSIASNTMVEATATIQSLRARIKRLEEAGDELTESSHSADDDIREHLQVANYNLHGLLNTGERITPPNPPKTVHQAGIDASVRVRERLRVARLAWKAAKEAKP